MTLFLELTNTDFSALKEEWNSLLNESNSNCPFLTWQWQSTWWEYFGKGKELKLLAVRNHNGRLIGIAPLFSERMEEQGSRVGFIGGTSLSDYQDIIAAKGWEKEVCEAVMAYLSENEWNLVDLHCLPEASQTKEILRLIAQNKGYNAMVYPEKPSPIIDLPFTWEEYLINTLDKKNRHELRRKIRKLENKGKIRWYTVNDPSSLQRELESFFDLFQKSLEEKANFLTENIKEFFRSLAKLFSEKGWLELSFLEIDGIKSAGILAFPYDRVIYAYNSGYDPKYSSLSAGIVLFSYYIKEAINRGIKKFDFLRGNERYKYHFGAKDSWIYRLIIERKR